MEDSKIISLWKLQKEDYMQPEVYCLISLLAILGKILESLIAQRLAFIAKTYSLLLYNYFGGLKQKTIVDTLLVLQEKIYQVWKNRKVLSLITFDIKNAFNSVVIKVLLDCLWKRQIPEQIVSWIKSFCGNRKTTITVNGETFAVLILSQAGLP